MVFWVATSRAANPGLIFTTPIALATRGEIDGIAVDANGNTYVAGWTRAASIGATPGVVQPQFPGGSVDTFIEKLDASGNLVFATYWGGSGDDEGLSIAVDPTGNIYVAGISNAKGPSIYPTTPGAASTTGSPNGSNGFVVKLNPTATAVIYSTLVPGAGLYTVDIAADAAGNAYFTGTVQGSDNSISATPGAYQPAHNGMYNPVVVKFDPTGAVAYATFLGETGDNEAAGIAVDALGNAYVSGAGGSDFPVTPGAYRTSAPGATSAFALKLNPQGSALAYSTFLGATDVVGRIRVDEQGDATSPGSGLPATPGAFQSGQQSPWAPPYDPELISIAKLDPSGSRLVYAVPFAGASRVAVDAAGEVYVTGLAGPGLPVTQGAFQRCIAGPSTAMFVARLNNTGQLAAASYVGGNGYDYPTAFAVDADGSVHVAATISSAGFPGWPDAATPLAQPAVFRLFMANSNTTDQPCLTAAIENGASFEAGPIAPGELVTLRGVDIGPAMPAVAQPGANGVIPAQLGNTQVFFNGIPAPVLYASPGQINAQVPWELAGSATAVVQVSAANGYSNPATEPIQSAAPALFHIAPADAAATPPFPGAILNPDGSLNSASNPAARGSVVTLFGTGGGLTSPPGVTGAPAPTNPLDLLTLPASAQIFTFPAQILYAGAAPLLNSGVFQLDIVVPMQVTPGINALSVRIGGFGGSLVDQLSLVTVAVK